MIINLASPKKSDIKYNITTYPDGHKHINFDHEVGQLSDQSTVVIKTRIITYDDMFILKQVVNVARDMNPTIKIFLFISYLLAGRYDREMHDYDSFDLKIVCNDLNNLNFTKITVVEPHSVVTTALLNRVEVQYPLTLSLDYFLQGISPDKVCFVVPDLGAVKRVESFLAGVKRDIPIVYSNKHRNILTGEITGIDIFNPQLLRENVIIYDDLCDGGRTFTELAKTLRHTLIVENIALFVTHGLFSKGVDVLLKENDEHSYLDSIYTTNSFQDQTKNSLTWSNSIRPNFKIVDVI